jgi:TnpA family transposase
MNHPSTNNRDAHPLQEYGRLVKTIFILRYLESEPLRRRIQSQLNKGEALHGLREFLLFANKGTLRKKQEEELMNQAGCLNLVTNAVVTWNTVYMASVRRLARITYRISLRSGNPLAIGNEVTQGISRWAPMTIPIRLHRP